ncbi:hypothetical protein SCOCK_660029 [Actinacidiphila cocklensis]|uniref:Uncharacterized protein n=1 Tax=Actinacidiphila cocklensis TaxID=887465 RepID=A0A9W4DXZ5_9ACTN|nr:hypothetical protein SCOCK_660029 [Actinacidiphila cocklensis]
MPYLLKFFTYKYIIPLKPDPSLP